MKRSIRTAVFLSVVLLGAVGAFAETVELVTYYPAPGGGNTNTGRLNASQGTFGNPYSIDNPADAVLTDGTLLVADRMGIGPVFGTTPPAGALHVVGVANQPDRVLFMPGAGGTLNMGIGILAPVFPLEVRRDQNGTVAAGAFSNPNAGNQALTDLRVGQDVETDNGQYGVLNYYGSGVPAGFQGYGNPNQVSLVAASGAVNGLSIATHANAPIKFLTNTDGANNERMRITGAGNVGIGNTYAPDSAVPNGAASGNLDINDVYLRSTGRWLSQPAGGGPKFITPVTVYSSRAATNWTLFDASAVIPTGATAVILEAEGVISFTLASMSTYVRVRKDASSSAYILLRVYLNEHRLGWGGQGVFPITPVRTFQFQVWPQGFGGSSNPDLGCKIRIVGYY